MKTFLWTTLFWIVAAIAGLLCLGFGNLGTQVLDNEWIASIMPKNLKAESCDAVLETALGSMDWCAMAEANNCSTTVVITDESESVPEDTSGMQESLNSILANQETMYNEMLASFSSLSERIDGLNIINDNNSETQSIESQREELQIELNNALTEERYEDAANIRDQIKQLGQ